MKDLKSAFVRVLIESQEQLELCLKRPDVDLIYFGAGSFSKELWQEQVRRIHKGSGGIGKLAALKLPQMFRSREERFLEEARTELLHAGFDAFLAGSPEEVLWLKENEVPGEMIITDQSVYLFNTESEKTLKELIGEVAAVTYSPELNDRQMRELAEKSPEAAASRELIVYGRVPLMVTAQCLRKTSMGCDKRPSWLYMKDRTGAMMPVRNQCSFCQNTIYNAVPTVLYDLRKELRVIDPDSVRYEFTLESAAETMSILDGNLPANYTRGHFRRGVE